MDSNISRDHIALVAMEKLIDRCLHEKPTIWRRIGTALGICSGKIQLPLNGIVKLGKRPPIRCKSTKNTENSYSASKNFCIFVLPNNEPEHYRIFISCNP